MTLEQPAAEGSALDSFDPSRSTARLMSSYLTVLKNVGLAAAVEAGFQDLRVPHLQVIVAAVHGDYRAIELARRGSMSRQALNHLLGTLEAASYVRRSSDPLGNKRRTVSLTTKGRAAAEVLISAVDNYERSIAAEIGPDAYQALRSTLQAVVEASGRRRRAN